jgi:hypothetical protein
MHRTPGKTPNPAVKRTHTGGAHLRTPKASSAPVRAAYFDRWAFSWSRSWVADQREFPFGVEQIERLRSVDATHH